MKGEGQINIADVRGHYSNCLAATFPSAEAMNSFFEANPNRLIVMVSPTPAGFLVFYTCVLEQSEIDEFNEVQAEARKLIDARKLLRDEAELKNKELQAAADANDARLLTLGRTCEKNHGGLVEELRAIKKTKKGKS